MFNQMRYRLSLTPFEPLEGRTLLSGTGPVATVIAPPSNVTVAGSDGTSIVVQYTDPAGISLATITGANLTVGVGSFAPSDPPVPVTVAKVTASTDSTTATVTYDLGAPDGALYSQDDDVYRVELNGNSVYDDAGAAAAANPLLGLYQVLVNPTDASFSSGSLGFATNASITQPDGKLVLAGSQNPSALQGVLERLNADGSPDTTFGSGGGIATTPGDNDVFNAVGLQSDGDIVVAGSGIGRLLLAQYTPAGAAIGQTLTPIDLGSGITASLYGLAVAPDNSIYAVGSESNGSAIVAHYLADGSLDTTFGTGGLAMFTVGSSATTSLSSVAVANNTVIVAGAAGSNAFVAELTAAGSFDPSFNSGTPDIVDGLAAGAANIHSPALAVSSAGDIYIASHTAAGDLALERLTPAGQPDSSFGAAGVVSTHFGRAGTAETDDADSILLRSDGIIVVTGTSDGQSAIAVYNSDGSPFSQFTKDAFSPGSDPTATSNAALGTLSGEDAVVLSTTGQSTVASEFDIAAAPTTTPPTTPPPTTPPPTNPPTTTTPAPTPIGTLGKVNGKRVNHLSFTAPSGASVTLKLSGNGTAQVSQAGNDVDLVITGNNLRLAANASAAFTLGSVTVTGSLAAFKAPAATLAGTFSTTGKLGTIALGSVTGTLAAAGNITAL
ncbi:MAG TPA: delta-60 repeat domain-containing protein, partial [Tepidisphaeraceae bacterium]|nr:delta-60 repeat domain-containing protein [Tepidisphaeraceae bacterium]